MLKRAVLRGVASTAGQITARRGSRAVALCYHSIHPQLDIASADPDLFRRQLDWLGEHCDVVTLDELLAKARSDERSERPAVAVTFDDGYQDNFTYATPLLADAGMTATFFITAGLVERDPAVIQRMKELRGVGEDSVRAMSWEQVGELAAAGYTVGSHTYSHPNLARLDQARAADDIERGKALLEMHIEQPVRHFAYPFGRPRRHFNAETVEAVRNSGHEMAMAVLYRGVRASDDSLAIPRFFVEGDDVARLKAKVEGYWDPFGLWQEYGSRGVLPFEFDTSGRNYP
jgi:peptidoglycan/xylan/chitin deacetylase (PgdA/CDA1 family)